MREESVLQPLARERSLIVEELADETLVYDLESHRAHCLNRSAALVWKQCDGRRSIAEIARRLKRELHEGMDEETVRYALDKLAKYHLLETGEKKGMPALASARQAVMTRRELVRRLGLAAAVALPLVTTIVAPTPAQAVTCLPSGSACTVSGDCCSGVCNVNGTCV